MKEKLIIISVILYLAILVSACGNNTDSSTSSESSETPTVTSSQSSSSQSGEQEGDSNMESSQNENNEVNLTQIPVEPAPPPKPAPEMSISEDASMVTIKKINLHGKTLLSVTDSEQETQILAYVDGLSPTNETFSPATGGSVYSVYVQRNNVVEQYAFTGQKTEDGFILVNAS